MRRLRYWLRHYFRPARVDEALDAELRACLDIMAAEAAGQGTDASEARRAVLATASLASTKELIRDELPASWLHGLRRDSIYATRHLLRHPLFTMTAVVSLALGIGASTAAYSWGHHMLLEYPAGVVAPARVMSVFLADRDPESFNIVSFPHFQELSDRQTVFSGLDGSLRFPVALEQERGAREATVEFVTGTFFRTLGVSLLAGRGIEPNDDVPGGPASVVISDRVWQEHFARSPRAVGSRLRLNGRVFTIVGVVAPAYRGIEYNFYGPPDVWTALHAYTSLIGTDRVTRRTPLLLVFGRLKDGVTRQMASNQLQTVVSALSHLPTDTYAVSSARVFDLKEMRVVRQGLNSLVAIVLTVTGLILAAGCFNTSSLLISQGIGRQSELGLRLAVGATRAQLLRQLMTECAVLGIAGGLGGAVLSFAVATGLERFPLVSMLGVPLTTPAAIDASALAFAGVLTLAAVCLSGVVPAALISTRSPMAGVAPHGSHWASPRRSLARQVILIAQVAVSVVLSVTAGLYAVSLFRIEAQQYPYAMDSILLARLNAMALPVERRSSFYDQLMVSIRSRPEVVAAGLSANPVLAIGSASVSATPAVRGVRSDFTTAGADYFKTLQIPIVAGREFTDHESTFVAIVNRTLADRLWPGESAVGHIAYFPGLPPTGEAYTIVGVVEQPRCQDQLTVAERPCVYRPIRTDSATALMLHMRTAPGSNAVFGDLRRVVQELSPDVVLDRMTTLDAHLGAMRMGPRVAAATTVGLAILATLLSAIGCVGLLLALMAEGRRDMAIRSAIGAPPLRLRAWMALHAVVPYAFGLAIGVAVTWVASRRLQDQLFATTAHDSMAFVWPVVSLMVIGIWAISWSTQSAGHTAPNEVLRS